MSPVVVGALLALSGLVVVAGPASAVASFSVNQSVGTGISPSGVAVNTLTNRVYVANQGSNDVTVLNGTTNTVVTTIPTGLGASPVQSVVAENTNRVYVVRSAGFASNGVLTVIDGATNAVTANVTLGLGPYAIAYNPVRQTIYVSNSGAYSVTVIDATTNTVTATINTAGDSAYALAADPTTAEVYAVCYNTNKLRIINGTNNTLTPTRLTLGTTPVGAAIDPVSQRLYVANTNDNTVSVVNTATESVVTTIPVGVRPRALAIDAGTGTVLVTNANAPSLSVIDTAVNAVSQTQITDQNPNDVAINPVTGVAYVVNKGSNSMWIYGSAPPAPVAPVITSGTPPAAQDGIAYSFAVTASGTAPVTFAATGLPAGLTIDVATGLISGTTTVVGSYPVSVTATNAAGSDIDAFTFGVDALAPTITSGNPPVPTSDAPYAFAVTASGTAPLTFSASGLPPGLAIDAATGIISGTTRSAGSFTLTVVATNAAGSDTDLYPILISAVAPVITSAAPPVPAPGLPYSFTVLTSGSLPVIFTVAAGALPAGLVLNTATGLISGTATSSGAYSFTITATNSGGIDGATYAGVVASVPPSITSGAPPAPVSDAAYSFPVTASGTAPLTYSATGLPSGLAIDTSTGVISGTTRASGGFSWEVSVTNAAGVISATYPLVIVPVAPAVVSAPPPDGTDGVAYSHPVVASGTLPATYSLSSGTLPPGLVLDPATGVLSGTPTSTGSYAFTLLVTNAGGSAAQPSTVVIAAAAPVLTSAAPPAPTSGVPYAFTVTASGTAPVTFTAIGLPPGLAIDPATGVISGTTTTAGPGLWELAATNAAGTAAAAYPVSVIGVGPSVTSGAPPPAALGQPYSFAVVATGSTPLTFSLSSGALPSGLVLDTASGVLSGTPTAAGTATFAIGVLNGYGYSSVEYSLSTGTAPALGTGTPPAATVGTGYTFTVPVTGTGPVSYAVSSGTLPAGLALDPLTGVLSGTPTTSGSYGFTVTVSSPYGSLDTPYVLVVEPAPVAPSIGSATPPAGSTGTGYSFTVPTSGTGPFSYAVTAGALPAGMTLDPSTGLISGTPTAAGAYGFTVTVTGPAGSDSVTYALQVAAPVLGAAPSIGAASPPDGTVGSRYSFTVPATGSAPIRYAVTSGDLPPGLALDPSTGRLAGTPTSAGAYAFSVTATGPTGSDTADYELTITAAPVSAALPTTGFDARSLVGSGFLLTLLGAVLVVTGRRRRPRS